MIKKKNINKRNTEAIMKADLEAIKQRNQRVEVDKAWETSTTRKMVIGAMTYIIIVIFLFSIEAPNPFLNAIVPVIGFLLSTATLSWCKEKWIQKIQKKK